MSLLLAVAIAFTLVPIVAAQSSAYAAPSVGVMVPQPASVLAAQCRGRSAVENHGWFARVYLNSCQAERVANDAENLGSATPLGALITKLAKPAIIASVAAKIIAVRIRNANRAGNGVVISYPYGAGLLVWGIKAQDPPASVVIRPVPKPKQPNCAFHWTRWLRSGLHGPDVAELQRRLNAFFGRRRPALEVDSDFGKLTYAAVRAFQQAKGLGIDGVVGPETQAALNKICP
jgi:hypothetical protein